VITPEADPAEFELWVAFEEVRAMDHSEAQTELIEDLVRRMTFRCRRFLAHAYQMHGRWNLVYPLFRECLDEYDRRPWRFDAEDEANLLEWYARPAECMVDFPGLRPARDPRDAGRRGTPVPCRRVRPARGARRRSGKRPCATTPRPSGGFG
jgi:hypothetical protein